MAVANELESDRAALVMINPAPYNAEAPPEGLTGEITPVELHYVRSNFAVPEHDGTLEIGGAVANPTTLTLDDLRALRSEEHTSELQSLRHLVCRLLLEKKKKKTTHKQ